MWYCVTLVVGGGNDVMMACWNVCRLSHSLSSPQALCRIWRLVINVPGELILDQLSGRDWMSFFMLWSVVVKAAVSWVMVGGWFWGLSGVGGRVSVSRWGASGAFEWWGLR